MIPDSSNNHEENHYEDALRGERLLWAMSAINRGKEFLSCGTNQDENFKLYKCEICLIF